jgi:phthiocerol/phenolphthiocerol synthesis type-I polyketide synthase E
MTEISSNESFQVAVIGMSGRFPGAPSLDQFWKNLCAGKESIQTFSDDKLLQMGVSPQRIADPGFVKVGSILEDSSFFDASFFGYSPREADFLDPQHRLMLECAWTALEDAGYAITAPETQVGVFVGCSLSSYLLFNLLPSASARSEADEFQIMISNDKDFLGTRIAYKLNLSGPCLTVQSGCSTSLVAVHLAAQQLLTFQCDLALAGGISVGVPQRLGYLYQPGGISSPDGHCKPFDAAAEGTIFGEGGGVVVMKRLDEALRDRDTIHAVILGSAINNDGAAKVGYTAPSIEGQTEVIVRAQRMAGVEADSIGYVEAHGTATQLGDPVEVAALTNAFRRTTDRRQFAGLGSVKSNIGHLDAAAGIAGLLKTILMLRHRRLVPSLHFQYPNPKTELAKSPFFVVTESREWVSGGPLRAGVSSFGIGGTNAHLILQEALACSPEPDRKQLCILSLSARTQSALDQATQDIIAFLEAADDRDLPDVAYTLHVGRKPFQFRRSILCRDRCMALEAVRSDARENVFNGTAQAGHIAVAFLFPGGGTQFPAMGRQLYATEPVFRRQIDECLRLLEPGIAHALRSLLYTSGVPSESAALQLAKPSVGLPAIFATEYALANLLMAWGVRPDAMLGHSLGEYTAACLAGVFTLQDALSLVTFRGRLFEALPKGAMLSVYASEQAVRNLIDGDVCIAAINGPEQCVVSGVCSEIDRLSSLLALRGIEFRRLHIEAAAHSAVIEPVLDQFLRFVQRFHFRAPSTPFVSNLTGTWITGEQAVDPEYWAAHLRHPVRFSDGLQELMRKDEQILLEIGPSRTLSSLAKGLRKDRAASIHACMPHPHDSGPELEVLYATVARMWVAGARIDWRAFYENQGRRRIPVPSYPFERQRFWIGPPSTEQSSRLTANLSDREPRIFTPSWVRAAKPLRVEKKGRLAWILLMDDRGIGERLSLLLTSRGERVHCIHARQNNRSRHLAPAQVSRSDQDIDAAFSALPLSDTDEVRVVHLWSLGPGKDTFSAPAEADLVSLSRVWASIVRIAHSVPVRLVLVADGIAQVTGTDYVCPVKSAFPPLCRVALQEHQNVSATLIDALAGDDNEVSGQRLARQILEESCDGNPDFMVALRGLVRWTPQFLLVEEISGVPVGAIKGAVYLITGGLGELGPLIADSFASRAQCTLVLTGRSPFPPKSTWAHLDQAATDADPLVRAVRTLRQIEEKGSEVHVVRADVCDEDQMQPVLEEVYRRYGRLDGVIHLAGVTGGKALRLLSDLDEEEWQRQLSPKVVGSTVLGNLLEPKFPEFCVLFSSTAAVLGGTGLAAYSSGCAYAEAVVGANYLRSGRRWISIAWDGWLTRGLTNVLENQSTNLDTFAIDSRDALALFHRILDSQLAGNYLVSKGDLAHRVSGNYSTLAVHSSSSPLATHSRPPLSSTYVAPENELQTEIAAIWSEVLGIERVGLRDNLFDLGGNSLIALRILSKLRLRFDVELPVTVLFEAPTVLALSEAVGSPQTESASDGSRRRGQLRRQKRMVNQFAGS